MTTVPLPADTVRALLARLERCDECDQPATKLGAWHFDCNQVFCDEHAMVGQEDLVHAWAIREALAAIGGAL